MRLRAAAVLDAAGLAAQSCHVKGRIAKARFAWVRLAMAPPFVPSPVRMVVLGLLRVQTA